MVALKRPVAGEGAEALAARILVWNDMDQIYQLC